jgi:hypothetical protein
MKHLFIAFSVFLAWPFFGIWHYSLFPTGDKTANSNTELAENITTNTTSITSEPIEANSVDPKIKSLIICNSLEVQMSPSEKIHIKTFRLKGLNKNGDVISCFLKEFISLKTAVKFLYLKP